MDLQPSVERLRFWRLKNLGTSPALDLATAARSLDPGAVLSIVADPTASPEEAWLESNGAPAGDRAMAQVCATRAWHVDELVECEVITALASPMNPGPPTHRLVLHYEADSASLRRLDDWYEEEHEEMLLRVPDWHRIRRFSTGQGARPGRLVVHDVSKADLSTSVELREAMATPRRQQLAERAWFIRSPRSTWEIVQPD